MNALDLGLHYRTFFGSNLVNRPRAVMRVACTLVVLREGSSSLAAQQSRACNGSVQLEEEFMRWTARDRLEQVHGRGEIDFAGETDMRRRVPMEAYFCRVCIRRAPSFLV
ncbi:hypothetical protein Q1695_010850 [Nippostrongylus brasiliensis]|nr:hypothetical protein Q1695_010850 [Nippostrongylus brasiliensis]